MLYTAAAHAGAIRTLDGKVYYGVIALDAGAVVVTPRGSAPVRIEPAAILSANFREGEPESPGSGAARWGARDVGDPPLAGSARFDERTLTVRAAGADIAGTRDQCHFVYQPLAGDGEITARIVSISQAARLAKAGLMFRTALDGSSPFAGIMLSGEEILAIHRSALSGQARGSRVAGENAPVWLKFSRRGEVFTGLVSRDGISWRQVSQETVRLAPQTMVGVALCSHNPTAICSAIFERPAIVAGTPRGVESSPGGVLRGVITRDGSIITGQVRSADTSLVRIIRKDRDVTVPVGEAARILLAWPGADKPPANDSARHGALLINNDFLEGELDGIDERQVRLTSVLFGLRQIDRNQVKALLLRDVQTEPADYELRLVDGGVVLADRLELERDGVTAHAKRGGATRLTAADLLDIRAGSARFRPLGQLKTRKVEGGDGPRMCVDSTTCGLPMALGGMPCEHGIGLAAGASVAWDLDGSYRYFTARFGVPAGLLPSSGMRLVVLADDKEVYRSPVRTSIDDALGLSVSLNGVKSLTVRLEGEPSVLGACGLLGEAALVK